MESLMAYLTEYQNEFILVLLLGSEVWFKYGIEYVNVLGLLLGSVYGIKYVFLLGLLLGSDVGIEYGFKYGFLLVLLIGFKYGIEYGTGSYERSGNDNHNGSLYGIQWRQNCIWKSWWFISWNITGTIIWNWNGILSQSCWWQIKYVKVGFIDMV